MFFNRVQKLIKQSLVTNISGKDDFCLYKTKRSVVESFLELFKIDNTSRYLLLWSIVFHKVDTFVKTKNVFINLVFNGSLVMAEAFLIIPR